MKGHVLCWILLALANARVHTAKAFFSRVARITLVRTCPFPYSFALASSFTDNYDPQRDISDLISQYQPGNATNEESLVSRLALTYTHLDLLNRKKIRVAAELSMARADYIRETDLRPLLQQLVTDWYVKTYARPGEKLITAVAFEAFASLLKSVDEWVVTDKARLDNAIKAAVDDGKVDGVVRENVETMLEQMWFMLSKPDMIDADAAAGCKQYGFLVSQSGDFAAAVSAMFRFFEVSHVVMSPGYKELRYSWDIWRKTQKAK